MGGETDRAGRRAIRCRGRLHGHTDGRTLRLRCREAKCRREGFVTFHVWDLSTGERVADQYEPTERVPTRAGAGFPRE